MPPPGQVIRFRGRCARAEVQLFVSDLSSTGVVRNAIALANRLCEERFAVNLVVCRATGALASQLSRDVELTELLDESAARGPRPVRLMRSLLAYRRHLRKTAPDLLLSAGNHGHMLCWAAWGAAKRAKRVFRISNDLDHVIDGRPESRFGRFARLLQFRLLARSADRLVLVSSHLLSHPLVKRTRAQVIANGVDVHSVRLRAQELCPHPWLDQGETPTLVAVGRLVRQKNLPTLLEALAIARRKRRLRLVVVGGGSGQARQALLDHAARLGIAGAVDIAEPTDNPFSYMKRAAAVVLPSWWEGASNVLLEAMACGTPVVASRRAGNAEQVLGYGRHGLLVDPADAHGLAEAILIQSGPDPCRPGDRAAVYDRDAALNAYVSLVARLLGGNVSRASKPVSVPPKLSPAPCARATAATRLRPRPVPAMLSAPGAR